MKVKTITYHSVCNYGAMLQAYALQQAILSLGHDAEIIDYHDAEHQAANRILQPCDRLGSIVKNLFALLYYPQLKRQKRRFELFRSEYMKQTRRYNTIDELRKAPPEADLFLAGSDQIWNCANRFIEAYFLDFDTRGARRAAYAASIGTDTVLPERREKFGHLVRRFDCITARESRLQAVLKELYQLDVPVVCDPVLLLQRKEWEQLSCGDAPMQGPYIFCYALGRYDEVNRCLEQLKQRTGLPVVTICQNSVCRIHSDTVIRDAGPVEFLRYLKNSDFVVCNSFHGTVLSTLFEKNFYSIVNPASPSRIVDYLDKIGLKDRIYHPDSDVSVEPINYQEAYQKIQRFSEQSKKILQAMIEDQSGTMMEKGAK